MTNAHPACRLRGAVLAAALAVACSLGACAPDTSRAELIYRVTSLSGGPPSEEEMLRARSLLDVRLLEAGYDSNDVSPLPPDRLRVVLPERVADRMDEVRRVLEAPEGLPVRLAVEGE